MANTIQHKRSSTASAVPTGASLALGELAVNTNDGRLFLKKGDGTVVAIGRDASELNAGTVATARLPTIGNITNAGAIGSTANLPVITTTSGVLTAGAFGTGANQFCQGNDSRLGLAAWVNFDGTANSSQSATYSQSGTQVTVTTSTAHGLSANQSVYLDFTSGTGTDGNFAVTSITSSTVFVLTHTVSVTTSGNCTIVKNTVRASYNVSSISDHAAGQYYVNFSTALADANYCALISARRTTGWTNGGDQIARGSIISQYGFGIAHAENGATSDSDYIMVAVFR